jgi:predicted deacylase
MTGVPPYSVGELTAQPGTQARGWCQVGLGPATVSLPIAITHGARPGPVLAVTAGIHGGEYVPMVAARQFVRGLDPLAMCGTVVVSLQSSPVAFEQRRAFVNPLDGQNLNRSFPGDPDGGPTARLADWLWRNLLSRADYYVDCHCGDLPEALDPFTAVAPGRDGQLIERARAMADCFDAGRLIVEHTQGAAIQQAALADIAAVLIEIGGQGQWSPEEVAVQHDGLRRVAALAGILPDAGGPGAGVGARPPLPVFEDAGDVISDRAGLWFPEVAVGTAVEPGTRLGWLEDVFGDDAQQIVSPAAGVLSYGLSSLAAAKGDLLASITRPVPGLRRHGD